MDKESKTGIPIFRFLETMKILIAEKEKTKISKSVDEIPKDKWEFIKKCGVEETIHSFDDYIEWILDCVYFVYNEDELLWLHLILGENDKLLEEIATGNSIVPSDLHVAMSKRLLKDVEINFDAYHEFTDGSSEKSKQDDGN